MTPELLPMTAKDVSAINMLAGSFMRLPADRRSRAFVDVRKNTTSPHALAVLDYIEGLHGLERMSSTEVLLVLTRRDEPHFVEFRRAALASERAYESKKERLRDHIPVYDTDTGRTSPGGVAPTSSLFIGEPAVQPTDNEMSFDNYDAEVRRTAADLTVASLPVLALGLAGEAGEVADMVKKVVGHGHPLDKDKLLNEIADCLWYCSALCQSLGFSLDEAAHQNSIKLRRRYPQGFSTEASLKRVDTEQK